MTAADLTDHLACVSNLLLDANREDFPKRWLANYAANLEAENKRLHVLLREQATAAAPKRKRKAV